MRDNVLAIFNIIAEAESLAHGCPIEQVHFHEVGQLDALADILASCMMIDEIAPDNIYASPLCVGFGHVHCAHGVLPVPAPATLNILKNVPIYSGHIEKEMTTPTGAAILTHFVNKFCQLPDCMIKSVGLGMGSRDFDSAPNMLRALLCDEISQTSQIQSPNNVDQLVELRANLDDMSGEYLSYAVDEIMRAGARDVWTTPIMMKKGRPAYMISCLVDASEKDKYIDLILKHTSSLGVRIFPCQRVSLNRDIQLVETELGNIRQKHAFNDEISRHKWEFEDIADIARKLDFSLETVISKLNK